MSIQNPILIAPARMENLARRLGEAFGLPYYIVGSRTFSDGEREVVLEAPVHNKNVILLFETAPPQIHRNIFELQCVVEMVRARGSVGIHTIFTYMAYLRQDERSPALNLLSSILHNTTVSVVEPHSDSLTCNYISLNKPIASFLKLMNNPLLISPDKGASARVRALASLLDADFLMLEKTRYPEGVYITGSEVEECKGRQCVIVDDILSTGQTLLRTQELIQRFDPASITAIVVHNLAKPKVKTLMRERGVTLVSCGYKSSTHTIDITPALVDFVGQALDHSGELSACHESSSMQETYSFS